MPADAEAGRAHRHDQQRRRRHLFHPHASVGSDGGGAEVTITRCGKPRYLKLTRTRTAWRRDTNVVTTPLLPRHLNAFLGNSFRHAICAGASARRAQTGAGPTKRARHQTQTWSKRYTGNAA